MSKECKRDRSKERKKKQTALKRKKKEKERDKSKEIRERKWQRKSILSEYAHTLTHKSRYTPCALPWHNLTNDFQMAERLPTHRALGKIFVRHSNSCGRSMPASLNQQAMNGSLCYHLLGNKDELVSNMTLHRYHRYEANIDGVSGKRR